MVDSDSEAVELSWQL